MFNKPNTNHLIQVLGFALLAFTFFVFFAEEILYFINTVSLRGYSMIEAVNIYNGKFEILDQAFTFIGQACARVEFMTYPFIIPGGQYLKFPDG